jgi:trans-2,3-dihydro-3-hydroxyanthranilate isomerase
MNRDEAFPDRYGFSIGAAAAFIFSQVRIVCQEPGAIMPVREFPFVHLDVFTSVPLEGNQLAVIPDARSLSDAEMQRLAKEMNLSETTFILPRDAETESREGVRVRIFTVEEELPFAGHPTLGTAWYLKQQRPEQSEIILHLNAGRVPVRFETREARLFGEMRQPEPQFRDLHQHSAVARALGLAVSDLDENLPIQTVSTGVPFTIVAFRESSRLSQLQIGWQQIDGFIESTQRSSGFLYFVARDGDHRLRARMIFYNGEDPATGSAAGCCVAWAVKYEVLASDEQGLIEQGREVLRPSSLYVRATKAAETVTNVRVGGHVVPVIDGKVTL